jgi:hypothetical protein
VGATRHDWVLLKSGVIARTLGCNKRLFVCCRVLGELCHEPHRDLDAKTPPASVPFIEKSTEKHRSSSRRDRRIQIRLPIFDEKAKVKKMFAADLRLSHAQFGFSNALARSRN